MDFFSSGNSFQKKGCLMISLRVSQSNQNKMTIPISVNYCVSNMSDLNQMMDGWWYIIYDESE